MFIFSFYKIMQQANKTVHGLWIGLKISAIELLTVKSFLNKGHRFFLWLYDPLELPEWEGLYIRDASTILSRDFIFTYKNGNEFGHGKGSLAGFSDLFRYKLLHLHGGWWTDMDMTCLKPLDFKDEYVFRNHDVLPVVGNLMKCPAGSELMQYCFTETLAGVNADNKDWLKPIKILNEGIEKYKLSKYIRRDITNADRWDQVDYYRQYTGKLPPIYAFHWMNEEWRSRKISKNKVLKHSLLAEFMEENEIQVKMVGTFPKISYFWVSFKKKLIAHTSYSQRQKVKRWLFWSKQKAKRVLSLFRSNE